MGKWSYEKNCIRGIRHMEREMLCQDRAAYLERDNLQIAVLLDGISQTDRSIIIFEHIAHYLTQLVAENMEKWVRINKEQLENVKKYIIEEIRNRIDKYKNQHDLKIEDCATTIMALALDNHTNKYILFHLGDGIMLSERNNGWRIESYPQNCTFDGRGTYHTVTDSADEKMQIYSGEIEDTISRYIFMTDGGYDYPADLEKIIFELKNTACWKESVNPRADDIGIVVFSRKEMEDISDDRQSDDETRGYSQLR